MPNIDTNVNLSNNHAEAIKIVESILNNQHDLYDLEKAKILMTLAGKHLNKLGAHKSEAYKIMCNAMEHSLALIS